MTTPQHESHKHAWVSDCRIIDLPHVPHRSGTLTIAQNDSSLPFAVTRIYYLYDIPGGAERGGHSHYREQRLLVALSGCFDVKVCDGNQWQTFTLRTPYQALYIPAGLWRILDNFSSGSVCLALSSLKYDEHDYVRDFNQFLELSKEKMPRNADV